MQLRTILLCSESLFLPHLSTLLRRFREFNVMARLRNSQIRNREIAFAPLQDPNGEIPEIFPPDISALRAMRCQSYSFDLNAGSLAYL